MIIKERYITQTKFFFVEAVVKCFETRFGVFRSVVIPLQTLCSSYDIADWLVSQKEQNFDPSSLKKYASEFLKIQKEKLEHEARSLYRELVITGGSVRQVNPQLAELQEDNAQLLKKHKLALVRIADNFLQKTAFTCVSTLIKYRATKDFFADEASVRRLASRQPLSNCLLQSDGLIFDDGTGVHTSIEIRFRYNQVVVIVSDQKQREVMSRTLKSLIRNFERLSGKFNKPEFIYTALSPLNGLKDTCSAQMIDLICDGAFNFIKQQPGLQATDNPTYGSVRAYIGRSIAAGRQFYSQNWCGARVVVVHDDSISLPIQVKEEAKGHSVRTVVRVADEGLRHFINAMFYAYRDNFRERLDHSTKYYFYNSLAISLKSIDFDAAVIPQIRKVLLNAAFNVFDAPVDHDTIERQRQDRVDVAERYLQSSLRENNLIIARIIAVEQAQNNALDEFLQVLPSN